MSQLSDFIGSVTNSVEHLTGTTFNVPPNVEFVFITASGGGGSGGAAAGGTDRAAAGGGSGFVVVREVVKVTPDAAIVTTIGTGGCSSCSHHRELY